jgi:hypothetical protein
VGHICPAGTSFSSVSRLVVQAAQHRPGDETNSRRRFTTRVAEGIEYFAKRYITTLDRFQKLLKKQ